MATIINVAYFQFKDKKIPIQLTWKDATKFHSDYEFNITKLFLDPELTEKMMMRLLVDGEFVLKLCYYFLEQHKVSYEEMLDTLPSPAHLEEFREAFWAATVNFSSPQLRGILVESWKELKKSLSQLTVPKLDSMVSSSDSSVEESTPTP
jgi:hypothetical protein